MEVKILEEAKNKIKFELIDEEHTLCNALRDELWNDKKTKIAGYNMRHPLTSNPMFILESEGNPKEAILSAVERLKKRNKQLRELAKQLK
ncbi:MAG: DNA-directed RNA polymerase subunit L [Nanoarchaeota archaeon]